MDTHSSGIVPLIKWINAENIQIVEGLLDVGADINVTDEDGHPPLMIATIVINKPIVELLLGRGAEVNMKNKKGETALYLAVRHGHEAFQRKKLTNPYLEPSISVYCSIICTLLQRGAILDTLLDLNPATAHLVPKRLIQPSTHILKIMLAGGVELEHDFSVPDQSLQDLSRKSIRKHLKRIHPRKNLYCTISQLGVPSPLQSFLLFYTLPKCNKNLKNYEKENVHQQLLWLMEDAQDENGMTLLVKVCQGGSSKLIDEIYKEKVIKYSPMVNHRTRQQLFKIHRGAIDSVLNLFKPEIDVDFQNMEVRSALINFFYNYPVALIEILILAGA